MLSYKLFVTLMELFRSKLCLDWNFIWIWILFLDWVYFSELQVWI